MTASDLITKSISTTSPVTAAYDADLLSDLLVTCKDSTGNTDVVEFWGTTAPSRRTRTTRPRVLHAA
jgi:hypothetical protein